MKKAFNALVTALCFIVPAACAVEVLYLSPREMVLAAARNDIDGIRARARLGASVNVIDLHLEESPLSIAIVDGNYEAADVLVQLGARCKQATPRGIPFRMVKDEQMRRILKKAVDWSP